MPVYLVTPLSNNHAQVGSAIKVKIATEDLHELQNSAGWLVVSPGTTIELSHSLGITNPVGGKPEPGIGSAMVTAIGSYFGLGSTAMWEWLKTRFERQS